jgi:hypothetical protein
MFDKLQKKASEIYHNDKVRYVAGVVGSIVVTCIVVAAINVGTKETVDFMNGIIHPEVIQE